LYENLKVRLKTRIHPNIAEYALHFSGNRRDLCRESLCRNRRYNRGIISARDALTLIRENPNSRPAHVLLHYTFQSKAL